MKLSGRLASTEDSVFTSNVNSDDEEEDDNITCVSTALNKSIPAPDDVVPVLKTIYGIEEDKDFLSEIIISHSHREVVSGRIVEWRGAEKERSSKVSSVVEVKLKAKDADTNPTFGQIKYFFSHSYGGMMTKFAIMEIFEHNSTALTSQNQWQVNLRHSKKAVVPAKCEYLSRPLVTAKSVNNKDILYILNN